MKKMTLLLVPMLGLLTACQHRSGSSGDGQEGAAKAARAPVRPLTADDGRVDALLARMTLDEKIGQMTQPDQEFLTDSRDIETLFLGSLLNGGGSDPKSKSNSLEAWTDMYDGYQSHALQTRLGIPLIYGVDAVHGHNNVVGAVIFPHNIGLGCTRNPDLVERAARVTAAEVRATGINWVFAPCVTVPQDERWGRTYEGFSEDTALVERFGAAAVMGFQGTDLSAPLSVVACAKHFVGDGGTAWGTGVPRQDQTPFGLDQGETQVDEETLRRVHLPPYRGAIAAGVGTIMVSYSTWNGVKCSGNKYLLTDVLKGELGFQGFLISDYAAIDQLPGDYRSDVETSINAGMDMVMVPRDYRRFISTLKALVAEGAVPMSRIDDAVRRILRVKFAMGLFDHSVLADRSLWGSFGAKEHRDVARECVRQSLVLLENRNQLLPLRKNVKRVHVAGRAADDIGIQCGGWTIEWQGKTGPITTGTTIRAAIQSAVSEETQVTYSADGKGADGATVAIAVIGEMPYAEMKGDRQDLLLSEQDLATVRNLKQSGVPVVVVLVSGRPLILGALRDQADALVAAWLPGTEGEGVADVLFGDSKPAGKLSFSWPRTMDQVPIHEGQVPYDPLYKVGYGLTY